MRSWWLAGVALAGAQGAQAQDTGTAAGLDEIIVTAQRREQPLQDVSIAVSVVDASTLVERGATTINDLENIVPGLEIEQAFGGGQPQLRLRGVGFEDYATNNTPTVGTYIDEVAFPIPAGTQGLLFDVERAEVLRGPQGTLYGRNTTGGAINIITGRPTDVFSAGALAEYGRFDTVRAEGFVSGPLAAGLNARLAVATIQGGGFQRERTSRRSLGDQDVIAGRLKVAWEPTDTISVTAIGQYNRDRSEGRGVYLFTPTPAAFGPPIGPDRSRRDTGFGLTPEFAAAIGVDADRKPFRDNDSWNVSLNARIDLGPVTLSSITAYQELDRIELNDWAALPTGNSDVYFRSKADVFSQEVRLSGGDQGPFRFTVGAYYSSENLDELYQSDFLDGGFNLYANTPYEQRTESISGFGQLEYDLTERLTLLAGARYEDETRKLRGLETFGVFARGIPGVLPPGFVFPFVTPQDREVELDDWSGKVGLEFRPRDDLLLYATASKGLKSGGFTAVNTLAPGQVDPFTNETLYAYEGGFKLEAAGRRVRLNGAVFYYDYEDQQVQGVVIQNVNGVDAAIGRITNAPRSEIYGVELELTVRPFAGLQIGQTVGWKEGEYREFLDPDLAGNIVDRRGQDIGFPELTYSGDIRYTLPIGGYGLTGAVGYNFRDESTLAVLRAAGDRYTVDSYWLVDASLTLTSPDDRFSIAAWGRNIFDAGYDEARNFFNGDGAGNNFNIAAPGRPATYGVRGSVRF